MSRALVLRFRDINVPDGHTIKEHLRIVHHHGSCWWGWLCREYEQNPTDALEEFKLAATERTPLTIALYDTGPTAGRLYAAKCVEIRPFRRPQRSPKVDLTPDYYRDRPTVAWFRLAEIAEADPSLVVGRTCAAMPTASPTDCFVDLVGRPIGRLPDLRRQEVTLWIVE